MVGDGEGKKAWRAPIGLKGTTGTMATGSKRFNKCSAICPDHHSAASPVASLMGPAKKGLRLDCGGEVMIEELARHNGVVPGVTNVANQGVVQVGMSGGKAEINVVRSRWEDMESLVSSSGRAYE